MKGKWLFTIILMVVLGLGYSAVWAAGGEVLITPLGQKDGDFCRNDKAFLFEDPNGTKVLYDPGRTVLGETDPRLGEDFGDNDIMILSSVHVDHIGTELITQDPGDVEASCGDIDFSAPKVFSNFSEIAAATGAMVVVGGEMRDFIRKEISDIPGTHFNNTSVLRHGGKKTIGNVTIAVVTAHHSNGVPRSLLNDGLKNMLEADWLTAYVGPEYGYVLTFSNGLRVYISGDTGHTADMAAIVRDYYEAKVAVLCMGDTYTMGPEEAAFAVNKLIKPRTVIPTHANEEATTEGAVNPGTRTDTFIGLIKPGIKVVVPLSNVPISCNAKGVCN